MFKVNNTYYGQGGLPVVTTDVNTPDQVFRCNDNTIFIPTLIIATNQSAVATRLLLVDADITDGGTEETYKDETEYIFDVNIAASATVVLDGDEIPESLQFIYGVGGYSTSGDDVSVFIEGIEIPMTSTT